MDRKLHLVTFRLDGQKFGLPFASVRRISRTRDMSRTQNLSPLVCGLIAFDECSVPVIDFRNQPSKTDNESNTDGRILIVNVSGRLIGILVSQLGEVRTFAQEEVDSIELNGMTREALITASADRTDKLRLISVAKLPIEQLTAVENTELVAA